MKVKLISLIKIFISFVFIASGLIKGIDPYGTSLKIDEYSNMFGILFLQDYSMFISVCLCSVELSIGLCVLFEVYLLLMLYSALILLLIFTVLLILINVIPGISIVECGCFGDLVPMTASVSLMKNLLLIGFIIILLYKYRCNNIFSKHHIIIAIIILLFSVCFPMYSAEKLPFVELSDYKIGADLHNIRSFQIYNNEVEKVTSKVLDSDRSIIIVKKQEFSTNEQIIINRIYNYRCHFCIVIIAGLSSGLGDNDTLYCSDNILKLLSRTHDNSVIYLEKGLIIKKYKLKEISDLH